jgi:DNA-binding transcriptional LysR family regulator
MTFHQLEIFSLTAKYGNITRASQQLRISQPTVSKHLKLLEEELKVPLYRPVGRGIELTDRGRNFLTHCNAILAPLEALKKDLTAPLKTKTESLAIGGSHGSSALFLPKLLSIFRKTHPQVAVTLRTNQTRVLEQLILNSQLELAVVSRRPRSPHLAAEPCREEKFVAFARPNHPLGKKRVVSLPQLLCSPLVIRGGGKRNRGTTESLLNDLDPAMRPNVVMRAESPVALKAAVQNGIGVGILLEDLVYADVRDGKFKALRVVPGANFESRSFLIYHSERPLSSNAQDFLALLRAWRNN